MQPWIRAEMFYNLGFWSLKHTDVLFPNLTDLTCAFNILSTWLQEICYLQEEFTRQKIDLATKLNEREKEMNEIKVKGKPKFSNRPEMTSIMEWPWVKFCKLGQDMQSFVYTQDQNRVYVWFSAMWPSTIMKFYTTVNLKIALVG